MDEQGALYSEEDVVNAFMVAQHADFSRTQVQRMVADAKRNGQSRDYGDGYNIYRVGVNLFRATVEGRPVSVSAYRA